MKYGFYAAVALTTAFGLVVISNLPTMFDMVTLAAFTVGGVVVGRRSADWF